MVFRSGAFKERFVGMNLVEFRSVPCFQVSISSIPCFQVSMLRDHFIFEEMTLYWYIIISDLLVVKKYLTSDYFPKVDAVR